MGLVAARELRNNTRSVLERVESGEEVTITVDGRPVAALVPLDRRPQSMPKAEFIRRIVRNQADAQLAGDLRDLMPETTDDLPL